MLFFYERLIVLANRPTVSQQQGANVVHSKDRRPTIFGIDLNQNRPKENIREHPAGQYDRAIQDNDQAIKLNPRLTQAINNRANAIAKRNMQ